MYRRCINTILVVALLAIASTSYSQELREHFTAPSALGIGGAYTAVANNEDSIWTNPAGIAKAKKFGSSQSISLVTVPNFHLGINSKLKSLYISNAIQDEKDLAKMISESDDLDHENPYWGMFSLSPTILFDITPSLPAAFGLFSHTTMTMHTISNISNDIISRSISDSGAFLNLSLSTKQKLFNIATQVRFINRHSNENLIKHHLIHDRSVIEQQLVQNSNKMNAFAMDVGAMYTFSSFWFPTIGISVLNLPTDCSKNYLNTFANKEQTICGTVFKGNIKNANDTAVVDPMDLRIGASITPRFTKNFATRLAADIHNIHFSINDKHYGLSDVPFKKKLHAGLELLWGNPLEISPFSIKIGTNEELLSAGLYLREGSFSFDFTTYAKYVGSEDNEIPDRRYILGVSMLL